jgi:transcriptional antiterminator RfaH
MPQDEALTIREPMFPRYLFLRPTRQTQSLAVVRSTVGVSRLVLFGQQPATLADGAVQVIRQAESLRERAELAEVSAYKPGMPVRLLDPALSGLQALVQSVSKDRVTLLLEILGRPQSVQVEFGRIAPL